MRYKILGTRTGLKVSEFALGTGMLGQAYGYGTEPKDAQLILENYANAGGNFFDISDAYQAGESERTVGAFLSGRRDDFIVATKFSRGPLKDLALGRLGNTRKVMIQSVEASLKRLETDRIDIYFAHLDDRVTPVEEIMRGFEDLITSGKIVYGGLSNFPAWRVASAATLAQLRGWGPLTIQVEYNLMQRTAEREILPMADGFGIGVIGYSPLASGFLTGKYRKGEKGRITELMGGLSVSQQAADTVVDALLAIADELGVKAGQAALAWVKAKGVIPIIGPRTAEQLADNLAAATVGLTKDHMQTLDNISAFPLGYPHDLLNAGATRAMATGGKWDQIDFPARTVA
jgi:aryl-alcohol dehydrogenase-like predicted oxidoreductase